MPNQIWATAMVNATTNPKNSVAKSFRPPAPEVYQEGACFAENKTSAIAILPTQEDKAARRGAEYVNKRLD
jgi:hypothetical protein